MFSKRTMAVALGLLVALANTSEAGKRWRTYDNCHLEDRKANDGDSFHMKYTRPGYGRRYYIRLYWVDCPETDDRYPVRVKAQAEWWGITEEQVIQVGKEATKFTEKVLKDGFVVHSKLQDARGGSEKKRNYANVVVDGEYLSILLVENGLARIYGLQEVHEGGPKETTFHNRLKAAESEAKRKGLGVWRFANASRDPFAVRTPTVNRPTPLPAPGRPSAPATPTLERPPLEEQEVVLSRALKVYSLKSGRHVGTLPAGHDVLVLGEERLGEARIRFTVEGRRLEGKCYRADLGL